MEPSSRILRDRLDIAVTSGAILCCTLLPASPALAQQPGELSYHDESVMPTGHVGERISSLIASFNAGDSAAFERFLTEETTPSYRSRAPLERYVGWWMGTRRQWGEITFHGIRTYTPPREDETIVIVRDANYGAWRALVLRFDAGQDHRIAGIGVSAARTPTNVSEPALSQAAMIGEATAVLERTCARDVFSGTALIAHGAEVLLIHACGEASKRFHVPNDVDTKFNLGSMNKMFTSVAVMQLVEQGIVSLDDPISRYVDESWLPRDVTDRITVHHLLSHTSGLGNYFNDKFANSSRALYRQLDDYKPLIRDDRPAFEPGTDWSYSNTGMFLLGVVIEHATGENYFDYVREHIYHPAGMEHSDSYELDSPVENLAIGYDPAPDSPWEYRNNLFSHVIKGGPAGGGFSTVGDLHHFALALLAGALVSEESRTLLWTDHAGAGYGYGFGIEQGHNGKVVGHGGGFAGISANLDIMLDRGYVVAVMSNYDRAAGPIASSFAGLIARVPPDGEQE